MARFDRIMKTNLRGALKEVKKFEETTFWGYFKEQMDMNQHLLKSRLLHCELEEVESVRAKIACNEILMTIPKRMKEQIGEEIDLQSDAVKVEAARKLK